MKWGIFGLTIFIVGMLIFSGCVKEETPVVGGSTTTPTNNTGGKAPAGNQGGQDTGVQTELDLKVGEMAKTSELEVTVKSVEWADSYEYCITPEYCTDYAPAEGSRYLFAIVEIKNVEKDQTFLSAGTFSATDSEGNAYDIDAMNLREDKLDLLKKLYKGQKTSGSIMFEIPTSATNVKILYDFGNMFTETKLASWEID